MGTKARYYAGNLIYYDDGTQKTVASFAPVVYHDTFIGTTMLTSGVTTWTGVIVGAAPPTVSRVADYAGGAMACALTADNQAQVAHMSHGNERSFNLKKNAVVEWRARLSVVPTLASRVVFGLAGDYGADPDAIDVSALFSLTGSAVVNCMTDDTGSDSGAIASGVTMTLNQWYVFRIDFGDLTNVLFYIDGANVATGTTFDMSTLSDAEAVVQPYIQANKGIAVSVGTVEADEVWVWADET